MKTILICLFALSLTGCASLFIPQRGQVDCYLPKPGTTHENPQAEMDQCLQQSVFPVQYHACMRLKGFEMGQCYADNGEPVQKASAQ